MLARTVGDMTFIMCNEGLGWVFNNAIVSLTKR
jgi:hypothetical protein